MSGRNFTPFPTLTTERLTLRQLTAADQQAVLALRSDPEINKYLNRAPCNTLDDALLFIHKIDQNIQNNKALYWVITLRNTTTFVGTICLFDFSDEENRCEIGYELMTAFQGRGIMTEALKAVTDYAFHTLHVREIVAFTHKENRKSTQLLSKLNFLRSSGITPESPDFIIFTRTHSA